MLVLARKQGESIIIGNDICVSVLRQEGGRVRLGITAPPRIPILRAEIAGSDQSRNKFDSRTPKQDHVA